MWIFLCTLFETSFSLFLYRSGLQTGGSCSPWCYCCFSFFWAAKFQLQLQPPSLPMASCTCPEHSMHSPLGQQNQEVAGCGNTGEGVIMTVMSLPDRTVSVGGRKQWILDLAHKMEFGEPCSTGQESKTCFQVKSFLGFSKQPPSFQLSLDANLLF